LKKFRNFVILKKRLEFVMSTSVAQMTKKELAQMLSTVVEQKLIELLGDPDEGLVLKENFRKRLIRQKKAVSKGEGEKTLPRPTNDLDSDVCIPSTFSIPPQKSVKNSITLLPNEWPIEFNGFPKTSIQQNSSPQKRPERPLQDSRRFIPNHL
jgi:hypothetical protein